MRVPNPRRVAAGKLNHARRLGLTPAGVEALRLAAGINRPWESATGPRTPEGKAKSSANGLAGRPAGDSIRAAKREVAAVFALATAMAALRPPVTNSG